ncbi:MAG: hypothetical protein EBQ89_00640, partial [Alphaproteobacteria bacterium]|nr:hypothetical protein [Alphaproteobacteria bacterium]
MITQLATGVLALIDKIIPDPAQREDAKIKLLQTEGQQALTAMEAQLRAIVAEAQSADPWTSRARPSFLYVIYFVILLCVVGAIVGIWWPAEVTTASQNLSKLFRAVPEELWALFGVGYLGYTGARSFEKTKG